MAVESGHVVLEGERCEWFVSSVQEAPDGPVVIRSLICTKGDGLRVRVGLAPELPAMEEATVKQALRHTRDVELPLQEGGVASILALPNARDLVAEETLRDPPAIPDRLRIQIRAERPVFVDYQVSKPLGDMTARELVDLIEEQAGVELKLRG